MFSSIKILILSPLPFLLLFLFPISLNPDSLINFTLISMAFLFTEWGYRDTGLQTVSPQPRCGSHSDENARARCSGARGWRLLRVEGGDVAKQMPQNWLAAWGSRHRTHTPQWTQGEVPGGRGTRCYSLAIGSVVHKLAASASPAERSPGPTSDLTSQDL